MSESALHKPFLAAFKLRWNLLLRWVLHLWVKTRVLPDSLGETGLPPGTPVCYVLDNYALSSLLILDKYCEQSALDRPLLPINGIEERESRAYTVLKRTVGFIFRRPSTRRSPVVLKRLVDASYENPELDIHLVPVTVFIGRAPDKSTALAKILFAENWGVVGRFRRMFGILINGRDTLVQFSRPISLRELAEEDIGAARSLRKVSRILRIHFRHVRAAAIGPDLSHRRTLIGSVLKAPAVREAVAEKARRNKIPIEKAERVARKYALEIAADYSYTFIRVAFMAINWFTSKIFTGIHLQNFEQFKRQALNHEIIYVPCHRSHVDYLLVSYLLYQNGFVAPHIAAGVNLNLPVIGPLLRKGGAFYLRRTFRSQKLYSAVFNEYFSTIMSQGVAIEYFIEGTRSRTGRLLQHKAGMLSMTVRSYLNSPVRPVLFQPVYIGYEQLIEGNAYTHELSGRKKKTETLSDLLKVYKVIRRRYGETTLSFGQPIFLEDLLEQYDAKWREGHFDFKNRPPWLNPLVDELGTRILTGINEAADVNPVNLLATVLLSTPKHALGQDELHAQLALYRRLLRDNPFSRFVRITELSEQAMVDHGFDLGLLQRKKHPMGDILSLKPEHAVSLTYFRNNVMHLFALPSLIACCFLNQRKMAVSRMERICRSMYPFLKAELFLPWSQDELKDVLDRCVQEMVTAELLTLNSDGVSIQRAEGGSEKEGQLNLLARNLLQTLERYYITIAVLTKNGSGGLSRPELEKLCILAAQRISQLHEFEAPEFYDRRLFRQLIGELRNQDYLSNDEVGKLEFGEQLAQIADDARFILSKEIRHSIQRAAPEASENGSSEA